MFLNNLDFDAFTQYKPLVALRGKAWLRVGEREKEKILLRTWECGTLFWTQVLHNQGSMSGHSSRPRQERWNPSRHFSQHNNSPKSLHTAHIYENPSPPVESFLLRSLSFPTCLPLLVSILKTPISSEASVIQKSLHHPVIQYQFFRLLRKMPGSRMQSHRSYHNCADGVLSSTSTYKVGWMTSIFTHFPVHEHLPIKVQNLNVLLYCNVA